MWPLSRALYPKQFMDINGATLLEQTLARSRFLAPQADPIIVCNEEHRFYVAAALQRAGIRASLLLEPEGRNTAPAIALAALAALEFASAPLLLVLPSDQLIKPLQPFQQALDTAKNFSDHIITFGITPDHPASAYGYIQKGAVQNPKGSPENAAYPVARFIEKPDGITAQKLIDQGDFLWNSGIFMMRADVYLDELKTYAPKIYEAVQASWRQRSADKDFIRPQAASFMASPSDSVDYAVMEKTAKAVVMPLTLQWSDLGSWEAFYQSMEKDENANVCVGDVLYADVHDCYLHSSNRLLAALGVEGLAVIETADAVLVVGRERTQDVKNIVETLKKQHRPEFELHPLVYRPWGSYQRLVNGDRFQVKRMIVEPGAELSLQKHHHRAEHWVVVGGTAEVTLEQEVIIASENQSVYIPLGAAHRLKNPGIIPLVMIEIQTGSYLGEDDIIRLQDEYGRHK